MAKGFKLAFGEEGNCEISEESLHLMDLKDPIDTICDLTNIVETCY